MDLYILKAGDRVRTADGAVAEVVAETEDGQWVKVRYLAFAEDPSVVGSEDLCHADEIEERLERAYEMP